MRRVAYSRMRRTRIGCRSRWGRSSSVLYEGSEALRFCSRAYPVVVQPPFETVAPPVLHESGFGQIWPPRLRPCLLPPQVDAGAVAHPVGADDAAVRRPLARESMFETIPVSGRGDQRTRLVPAILSAVAPAAANSIVEQQSPIRIEVTATDDRASCEILDAFGRARRVPVCDAGARPCRNGAAVSRPQRPGR